jgi:trimethylamine--corrinoid protein Co-methyltransferase
MYKRMTTYSTEALTHIHDGAMDILKNTGVKFDDDEAIDLFKKASLKVDDRTVYFSENIVNHAIETAPPHFSLDARDPAKSVAIGGEYFALAPGYGAPFIISAEGQQRETTLGDYHDFCKLVQTSPAINVNGFLMVMPADVPTEAAHLDMLFANVIYCDKPFMGSSVSREAAKDCIHMARIVWGTHEKVQQAPVTASLITPLSPLQYTTEMVGAVIELARYNQACIFGALILGGSSGPITLAGILAQQTAEILAGVTLTQLVHPGAPVIVGGTSAIMDMRTGCLAMGAPEVSRIASATAQMAKFYNLPVRCGCAVTDSQLPDAQAGFESGLNLMTAIQSGSNFILHAAGILGSYGAMSFEKFIIDEEICSIILESLKPIEIDDQSIDIDLIKDIGIGGEYITHPKTLELCRTAFFLPNLMNRKNYAGWKENGGKYIHERAATLLEERLSAYQKPDIDPQIEKDLSNYIQKRKRQYQSGLK